MLRMMLYRVTENANDSVMPFMAGEYALTGRKEGMFLVCFFFKILKLKKKKRKQKVLNPQKATRTEEILGRTSRRYISINNYKISIKLSKISMRREKTNM